MAKEDRGTKREDPDTGKKFYDLNRDPIVSPYTGKSYPRSYFEQTAAVRAKVIEPDKEEEEVEDKPEPGAPEVVSLDDAEDEEAGEDEAIADVADVEEVEDIGDDDADVFLEEDEDDDDDLDFDVGKDDER